jgi:hypothetical protein
MADILKHAQALLDAGAVEVRAHARGLRLLAEKARDGADALCNAAGEVKNPSRAAAMLAQSALVRDMAGQLEALAGGAERVYASGRHVCIPTDDGEIRPRSGKD